jgi:AcrR family transcriptional regulator
MDEIATAASTSKGGVYFHFPTKDTVFRELMRTTADRLAGKVERAVAAETEPIARAEAGIRTVLLTFAGHRTTARLLLIDAVAAGRAFQTETAILHARFAGLIRGYLEEAQAAGVIPPLDAETTSRAWFGALNEIVSRWLLDEKPGRLEDSYPVLRAVLLRSVGVPEPRILAGDPAWHAGKAALPAGTAVEGRDL